MICNNRVEILGGRVVLYCIVELDSTMQHKGPCKGPEWQHKMYEGIQEREKKKLESKQIRTEG